MSVTDTIPPNGTLDAQKDATTKDTHEGLITMNGVQSQVVDGAHTHSNGIITNDTTITTPVEPIVIIADAQPSDVTATLLHKPNSSDNIAPNKIDIVNDSTTKSSNDPSHTTSNEVSETVVLEKNESNDSDMGITKRKVATSVEVESVEVMIESDSTATNQQQDNMNVTKEEVKGEALQVGSNSEQPVASSSSSQLVPASPGHALTHSRSGSNNSNNSNNNNNNNNSSSSLAAGNNPELRSSARNLRNSVLGIEEEEVDEHGVKVRKMKRKGTERSHSRIVLFHKKNLIGETIYKGHQSWVLMLNIQTGIRNAVGRGHSRSTVTAPKSPINPQGSSSNTASGQSPASTPKSPIEFLGPSNFDDISEFYASPKVLNFPQEGSSTTIPHTTGPFKFKDYCPHAFRFLRHRFGIDTADYMVSLCNTRKNGENALRELPTPGKSGSLFFFSHDMRFILKTIPKSEAKLLRSLLPSYVDHIANDENTLLPKFFGLHRVKPHRGRQVRFLVMNNIFQTRKTIHERYDLKGSTLGRQASEEEKKKDSVTFKDLDFRQKNVKIQIGQKRSALLDQLQRDVKFLAQLNIMDYSLLVGVHNEKEDDFSAPPSPQSSHVLIPKMNAHDLGHDYFHSIFQENDGGLRGVDESGGSNNKIYYIGIIDILMLYSLRKKVEHTYKSLRYGKQEEISSVSPHDYSTRFYEFMAASIT